MQDGRPGPGRHHALQEASTMARPILAKRVPRSFLVGGGILILLLAAGAAFLWSTVWKGSLLVAEVRGGPLAPGIRGTLGIPDIPHTNHSISRCSHHIPIRRMYNSYLHLDHVIDF